MRIETTDTPPVLRSSETELQRVLRQFAGLPAAVRQRISDLSEMLAEEPDDDDLSLESVAALCQFLADHRVSAPEIVADGDGRLMAEWLDPQSGRLSMRFRDDGRVDFALVGGTGADDAAHVRLCGVKEPGKAARSVRALTGRFPGS